MKETKSKETLLQLLRQEAGYSRKQLSDISGISESLLKQLENGEKSINKISLDKAFKLAVIFGIPIEYFVDTSEIKISVRYMRYYLEVMEKVLDCSPINNRSEYYFPYSRWEDPYEKLETMYQKEIIEKLKLTMSQKAQDNDNE